MSIVKAPAVIGAVALICSSAYLFVIKYKVQQINKELIQVEAAIKQESESIHILKAELAYLSKPQVIKQLSDKYLNLQLIQPEQFSLIDVTRPNMDYEAKQNVIFYLNKTN